MMIKIIRITYLLLLLAFHKQLLSADCSIPQQHPTYLFQLPDELILKVYKELDPQAKAALALTCRKLYRIAHDHQVWKETHLIAEGRNSPTIIDIYLNTVPQRLEYLTIQNTRRNLRKTFELLPLQLHTLKILNCPKDCWLSPELSHSQLQRLIFDENLTSTELQQLITRLPAVTCFLQITRGQTIILIKQAPTPPMEKPAGFWFY